MNNMESIEIKESPAYRMKQKKDRYEMHKYWGKKPSNDLYHLISKYSSEGDILLDPFAGYGVFCCEAYIMQRNIVCNDLNPISNFIQEQLLSKNVDFDKLDAEFNLIVQRLSSYVADWYKIKENTDMVAITVLRDSKDEIIKCKYKVRNATKFKEYEFTKKERELFKKKERDFQLDEWIPNIDLIENSRISAKERMAIKDIFTKRTMACHSMLYKLVNDISSGSEKRLLLLAFTSNLANCSKLVPPIKSRGDMTPGAWMTGFYWGETYLENNVLHYFKNRYNKVIKGKKDYLSCFNTIFHFMGLSDIGKVDDILQFSKSTYGYLTKNEDARSISLPSESIDYIFTDPPYGDSVPYFEQSIIWNSWLKLNPEYDNEIVVSNSPLRQKNIIAYRNDIEKAISEIFRVLKKNKYFSITFHSLSGSEWNCLTNACIKAGFEIHDLVWLTQKTFTPRQLNRGKSVKGDVLITLIKPSLKKSFNKYNKNDTINYFEGLLDTIISGRQVETNEIFMKVVKEIFDNSIILADVNFFEILNSRFNFTENKWSK
ncbi:MULTISPECIES: DNA methyltransferase [Spirulina sp. CCY15215]|uniref:DNA methyltransferase n=1 Tax=Spirulina sp. CCY15215 TaxID=2767591 RepID=UPI00194DB58C|nr:DNA methyltransferase [Spirulina major]